MYKLLYNNLMPEILSLIQLGVFAILGASSNVFTSNVIVVGRLKAAELIVLVLEK